MAKNIIICCDGTGNKFGIHNTNVVSLYQRVVRDQDQIAYYDPGIGTFSILGLKLGKSLGQGLGAAFGYGITQNLVDAYSYLMRHYEGGDKVYLFGFSRGAYTARVLAGMLHKVGLLQDGSQNQISYAIEMYMEAGNDIVAAKFKETYSNICKPHFVGVWDTVSSMGSRFASKFLDADLNSDIKNAVHAISIDEKRRKFPILMWNDANQADGQMVKQVWFPGVHSDVGGFYPERGLSDASLSWMLDEAESCGLRLKEGYEVELRPNPSAMLHESYSGWWRLFGKKPREIPEGASIHNSVIERMNNLAAGYRPRLPVCFQTIGPNS